MSTSTTIEQRALTYYRADLDRIPPLTREEETTLVERLRVAREQTLPPEVVTAAKQRLVEGLQRLVMFLALKQAPRFVRHDLEDLIQEASLALLEAIERCAFLRESFSGYASYVIRRAFALARTRDFPVSITHDVLRELAKRDQIAGNPLFCADSLDTPLEGTDDLILADTVEAPAPVSREGSEDPQKSTLVESLLSGLSERQRVALRMRYGLDEADGREHSIAEIAAHLGISDTATGSLLKHALISCRRLAEKRGVFGHERPHTVPLQPVAPPRRPAQQANPLVQHKKLQQAEQQLRGQWERITANRLAEVAHVDKHIAREYLHTHRDPAYEAELFERAQQPLREACAQLEAAGQPITIPALVKLTHLGSKLIGAFLNARAGNAQERMTLAYQKLQTEGWRKIGDRRLSQAAQVSEHRAKLFLRQQAAGAAAHPAPQAEPIAPTMPPAPMLKGTDSVDASTLLPAVRPVAPRFVTYDLSSILLGAVVLNEQEGILTHVSDTAEFAAQACFPAPALALTRALLEAHPAPCSQVALYAIWAGITLEEAHEMLAALSQAGYLDLVLRGLHEALAECRAKLAALNLGIQPVPEEDSYRLFRLSLVQ